MRRCSLKYMLTISSLFLGILAYFCVLLGSLLGPAHLLVESAAEIGFQWDSCVLGWERPGLPVLSNFAGPIQHLRAAVFWTLGGKRCPQTSVLGKVFAGAPFWTFQAPCSSLTLAVFGRDKALLGVYLLAVSGLVFCFRRLRGRQVPCRFCGGADNDGHLFWDCPCPSS